VFGFQREVTETSIATRNTFLHTLTWTTFQQPVHYTRVFLLPPVNSFYLFRLTANFNASSVQQTSQVLRTHVVVIW